MERRPRANGRIPPPSRAQTTGPEFKKALVTSGAGFVGSHLSERLLADGWEVFALDDVSTGSLENVAHLIEAPRFHLVVESVLSPTMVSELVHKCDVVYHLPTGVGVRLIVEQPVHTLVTNVEGTETVLEYCSRFRKRVLVASTSEVYGDHPEERPLVESARRIYGPTTARRWAYAGSRAMDEFLALAYQEDRGLDCVIDRCRRGRDRARRQGRGRRPTSPNSSWRPLATRSRARTLAWTKPRGARERSEPSRTALPSGLRALDRGAGRRLRLNRRSRPRRSSTR